MRNGRNREGGEMKRGEGGERRRKKKKKKKKC